MIATTAVLQSNPVPVAQMKDSGVWTVPHRSAHPAPTPRTAQAQTNRGVRPGDVGVSDWASRGVGLAQARSGWCTDGARTGR